jgi:hypothetical protein
VKFSAVEEITDTTATLDLSAMAEARLLDPVGEKHGYQPNRRARDSILS